MGSLPQAFPMWIVNDLILLHHHHLLHPSTRLHLQFRTITLTLARPTLGATASTRTPTATRWRRSFSRISASHTPRRPQRTTDADKRRSCVRGPLSRIATIFL